MAATSASNPTAAPAPAALVPFVRGVLGEAAAIAQVVLGGIVVVAAAERRSVLSSANHGAFTSWFAGPLHGLWPSLTHDPAVLHTSMHRAMAGMLVLWLVVVLAG